MALEEEPLESVVSDATAATPFTAPPHAVVLDTNVTGRGTFNAKRVRDLAERLARSEIEVWIPRQVLLEWARHSADEAREVQKKLRSLANAGLFSSGLPSSDAAVVAEVLTTAIEAIENVTIVPMTGDAAIAGITDQVLGTGPGSTSQTVKTGAVDSSLVRDAVAHANGDITALLFCSANASDIFKTTRAMGFEDSQVRLCPSIRELYASLFASSAAGGPEGLTGVAGRLASHLLGLSTTYATGAHPLDVAPWIDVPDLHVTFDLDYVPDAEDLEILSYGLVGPVDVLAVTDLEILDVKVDEPKDSDPTYTAILEFLLVAEGLVEATGYMVDSDGEASYSWFPVGNAVISVSCTADLSDLHVSNVEASDSADVTPREIRAADPGDLWTQVTEPLTRLSGLSFDDGDLADGQVTTINGLEGRSVLVEPTGCRDDEDWELTLTLQQHASGLANEGESAETGGGSVIALRSFDIACSYDPSVRVWAGADSFDSRPPYVALTSDFADVQSTIGVVWRWLLAGAK